MYPASTNFHGAATADGVQTRLLMRFADGTFLTSEDVTSDGNAAVVEITYPLNEDTDLTVGKCVSAELRTTVMNYHGLLSGFAFGDCAVSLGTPVETEQRTFSGYTAIVRVPYLDRDETYFYAYETKPYLWSAGMRTPFQPPFSPDCLVVVDDILYAGSKDGQLWAAQLDKFNDMTAELSVDNAFLADKLSHWTGRGLYVGDRTCTEITLLPSGSTMETWEYVPLGTFHIDTPTKRKVSTISCEALDGMQKFNVDCDDWWAGLTWPMTRGELLSSLCAFVGVTLGTDTFLGSDTSIASAPIAGNGLTGKDVLGWIAESACSYARMSRENALELVWFTEQDVTLTQNQHFGDSPAEYTTPAITALHAMVMNSDLGVVVPDSPGDNEYQIMDNPLLYGSTEDEIKPLLTPIYDRLSAFSAYAPNSVDAVCDWALEAGDVIQVTGSDGETRTLPIFRMELRWAGGGVRATYECTGGTGRTPADSATRKEFALYRAYHKLEVDITGIHSEIGDMQGNVANLELTASQLQTTVAGKIDGTEAQTMITQAVDKITLEVSSGSSGSTFVLKSDGVEISSQQVDLHVNALNVDGEIKATSVDFNTANISGTLSAAYIDVDSLTVKNANIESLYASKIIGGSVGGYLASGAISDSSHYLDSIYATDGAIVSLATSYLTVNNNIKLYSGESVVVTMGATGVVYGGTTYTWSSILSGSGSSGAVFG